MPSYKIGFISPDDPLGPSATIQRSTGLKSNEGTLGMLRGIKQAVADQTNPANQPQEEEGSEESSTELKAIIAEMKLLQARVKRIEGLRINPGRGHNGIVNESGGGSMTIDLNLKLGDPQAGGSGGGATSLNLQAIIAAAAEVFVTPGTYNSVMPTIGGVAINNATPPKLTIAFTGVIYAHLTMTDTTTNLVTSVEILNAATLPASTATDVYQTIATVVLTAGVISPPTNVLAGSQSLLRCGSSFAFGSV